MKQPYLDNISSKTIKKGNKHRLEHCPFPNNCIPVHYEIGRNRAGVCAGLITNSTNLDCVRFCQFYQHIKAKSTKGKPTIYYQELFMTPVEALEAADCLLSASREAIESNSQYEHHRQLLNKIRRAGDANPA